jgi:hypothetical protein
MEGELISLAATVSHLPGVTLDTESVGRVANGRELLLSYETAKGLAQQLEIAPQPFVRLTDSDGKLAAIGELLDLRGILKPKVVFVLPGN